MLFQIIVLMIVMVIVGMIMCVMLIVWFITDSENAGATAIDAREMIF